MFFDTGRKQLRLHGYDYSSNGGYFVTICAYQRYNYFGAVVNGVMQLNHFGKIAYNNWFSIPNHFTDVYLDKFIVMPDHIHGIIIINKDSSVGNAYMRSNNNDIAYVGNAYMRSNNVNVQYRNAYMHSLQQKTKMYLCKIIQQYKSSITREINQLNPDMFFKWQKSYHDRIIRNNNELHEIRQYIHDNPIVWELNKDNEIVK